MSFIPLLIMGLILLVVTVILAIAEQFLVNYGECSITINKEKILKVEGGGSLLGCFSANKIFLPSACGGKATCGHCKVKVLSGSGPILPTEEVYVTPEERASGIRLACQVKIKSDIGVYIPEYLLDTKEYLSKVKSITPLTHDIKHIVLSLQNSEKMNFRPGQYIQFKIPGADEFRAYSIASQPSQSDRIELVIRLVPGGLCSTYVHEVLEVGNEVVITGPFGEFFLQEDSSNDIVCIGGGCGMAPIRSILFHLIESNMSRKVMFFFGARSKKDLFYTEELRKIEKKYPNFKYVPALSEPSSTDKWEGDVGLITHVVERYVEDAGSLESYLCGPPPMIDASIKVLTEKGMKEENILFDKF